MVDLLSYFSMNLFVSRFSVNNYKLHTRISNGLFGITIIHYKLCCSLYFVLPHVIFYLINWLVKQFIYYDIMINAKKMLNFWCSEHSVQLKLQKLTNMIIHHLLVYIFTNFYSAFQ